MRAQPLPAQPATSHYETATMAPMTQPAEHGQTEREWQFGALDIRPVARWLSEATVPGFTTTHQHTKHLHDTYFDTADWRVNRARYTCRVRVTPSGAEVTLKSMADAVDGLRQRQEITEVLIDRDHGDLRHLTGPVGEALRAIAGRRELVERFVIDTDREVYTLADAEGEIGEVALDATTIPVGDEDHPVRLARVEVEVTSLERAEPFVRALRETASLTAAATSKFEAALIATGQVVTQPYTGLGPTEPTADMSACEYALAVLRKRFYILVANEPGTRLGHDPEYLHDMRVASRRMRAAIGAFKRELPPRISALAGELKWLTGILGDVRDLDVQLQQVHDWATSLEPLPPSSLDGLARVLAERRDRARARMLTELDTERFEALLDSLAESLRAGPGKDAPLAARPARDVLPGLLRKRYRRVRKHGDRIQPGADAAMYHRLRIESKKLRYAAEFAAPVLGKAAQQYARRVTALQDLLGAHQDAEVATSRLLAIAQDEPGQLGTDGTLAAGRIIERYLARAAELREAFPAVYTGIRGAAWRECRASWASAHS